MRNLRCRFGWHNWRVIDFPEIQYPHVASFAGTKRCHRCRKFSYWTGAEENRWLHKYRPGLW